MLGCYRKVDCADPEVFATAAVAVLSRYPNDVVQKVTDPSGIAARLKWVPTIYEIREACEIANTEVRRREESDARVKAQFAERDRLAAMSDPDRRKAFVKREMAKIDAVFAKDAPESAAFPLDIRGMEDGPEKDRLREHLGASIAAGARAFASTPCPPLSTYRPRQHGTA